MARALDEVSDALEADSREPLAAALAAGAAATGGTADVGEQQAASDAAMQELLVRASLLLPACLGCGTCVASVSIMVSV